MKEPNFSVISDEVKASANKAFDESVFSDSSIKPEDNIKNVVDAIEEENPANEASNLIKDAINNDAVEDATIINEASINNKEEIIIENALSTIGASSEHGNINEREKELSDALNDARNNFAKTEYNDRTATQRIRKALNMAMDGKYEESPNIKSAHDAYTAALKNLMNYKVDNLKNVDPDGVVLGGKDLESKTKELYSFFNLREAAEYYDARTEAKMAHLADDEGKSFSKKTWDSVRLKSAQLSEWYSKKVPTSVKIGLAAAAFIPGASTFALGKRTWGAFMMVAAGGMQLDKIAQFKDKISDKSERNKEFKNISAENGDVDFDKLKNILGEKIDNIDRKLSEKNLRSGANKFVAFAGAIFLGSSVMKGAMDLAEGKEMASTNFFGKLFAHKAEAVAPPVESVAAPKLPEIPKTGIFAENNATSTNAFEHAPKNAAEVVPNPNMTEDLTIKEGSNFSKTLLKELNDPNSDVYKYHPELKGANHQDIINRVLMDFKATHPEMGGHNPDYVLANSKIHFNPASLHAEMDEGQYGYYENVESGDADGSSLNSDVKQDGVDGSLDHQESLKSDVVQTQKTVVDEMQNKINALENHSDVVRGEAIEKIIASQDKIEVLDREYSDNIGEALKTHNDTAWSKLVEKAGNADRTRIGLANFLKDVADSDKSAAETLRSMRTKIVESDPDKWKIFGNMKMSEVVQRENFDKLPKAGKDIINYFQKEMKMPFRGSETMQDWTRRMVVSTERMRLLAEVNK
jgi:hypothetical protein